MHIYTAYNLCIHSEIPLPELISTQGEADAIIRLGKLDDISPETIDSGNHVLSPFSYGVRFLIQNGREIIIEQTSEADECSTRTLLLGFAMSLLLRQRGILVLHGSSVAVNDEVVAFVGGSGWGKSTLAEAFHLRGYGIVTDDVLPIKLDGDRPIVFPGFPQVKLWPETAASLGYDTENLPQVTPRQPKLAHRFSDRFNLTPLPLRKIYILAKGNDHEISNLPPQIAVMELVRHTRSVEWITAPEFVKSNLLQCATLVKQVPISRFSRKPAIEELSDLVNLVEKDLAATQVRDKGLEGREVVGALGK